MMEGYNILYLCGAISSDKNYKQKFAYWKEALQAVGYEVLSPVDLNQDPADVPWRDSMKDAIGLMMKADGVARIYDWSISKGAQIEIELAGKIGMKSMRCDDWIQWKRKDYDE